MSDPLLALAELRRITVDVDGHSVLIREFSALEWAEFTDKRDTDRTAACAYLLQLCVLNEDGTPRWTQDEARQVAGGAARVVARLVNAIQRLSGFSEKHEDPGAEVPVQARSASGENGHRARKNASAS
jgi:hypothetical protein